MTLTKSADLVLQAERTRPARLTESLESIAALRNDDLTQYCSFSHLAL